MADVRINALSTTATSSASDDYLAIDGSANGTRKLSAYSPTFGGNLTVSGTGTSSFGGRLESTQTGAVTFGVAHNGGWTTGGKVYSGFSAGALGPAAASAVFGWVYDPTTPANSFAHITPNGTAEGAIFKLTTGGNLLIGTTTDSGNGKLQLATHTTSAGGIGFGTDVSLYRSAAGTLFTNAATFTLPSTGDLRWDGGGYVTIGASSSLVFRNLSATTILTLDGATQSATVAGTVKTAGSSNSAYLSINTNQADNTAGPVTITIPDNTAGFVTVASLQSGIGKSSWMIPYVKNGGTIVLGTPTKSIISADPVSSATASSGNISLALVAANTFCKWGINSTPF